MIDYFPESRSSFAWRDIFREWRAAETHPWRGFVLDAVIADLGNSNASDGLVPVVQAVSLALQLAYDPPAPAQAPVQDAQLPLEMDVD